MSDNLPGFGIVKSVLLFGSASLALYIAIHHSIPFLMDRFGMEIITAWFLSAGFLLIAFGIL